MPPVALTMQAHAPHTHARAVTGCREGCPTLPPPLTLLPEQDLANGGRAGGASGGGGGKPRVSPAATTSYMTCSVMPQHANTLGITFGGQVGRVVGRAAGAGGSLRVGAVEWGGRGCAAWCTVPAGRRAS